ncbi:MAG: universal stress protein [Pseudomonadota bacterium]
MAQAVGQIRPDLLVIGSHRRRVLRDIFAGTTAERAICSLGCPVLVVNAPPVGPYNHARRLDHCHSRDHCTIRGDVSARGLTDPRNPTCASGRRDARCRDKRSVFCNCRDRKTAAFELFRRRLGKQ